MRKWSIGVKYTGSTDSGKIRATSVYWCEAEDIAEAIQKAKNVFDPKEYQLGTIIPGHHLRLP